MRPTPLLLAAISLGFSVASSAQTNQPAQSSIPVIKTNTHAVVVDVVVTRGKDEPVPALTKQDFQLTEDGKPQPIDFFEEHTAPSAATVTLPKLPADVYSNVPAAPLSDSVSVLLLDSLNTPRQDQITVRQQILDFLKAIQPSTRIAIFTLGSQLRFIQGFTSDASLLRAALNDKKNGTAASSTYVSRTRNDDTGDKEEVQTRQSLLSSNVTGGNMNAEAAPGVQAVLDSQKDYAQFQDDRRTEMTLEALRILARYLAGVPGRKNLIWFTSSIPIHIFPMPGESLSFNHVDRYSQQVKDTADLLTVSKVAVYPIGAEGLMNDNWMNPDNSGKADMNTFRTEAADRSDRVLIMHEIAADTGGEAIYNTNDLNAAMNRAIQNGAHYYTLVYTPSNSKMDGQFRRIEVKLGPASGQRKFNLSYRRGYYAEDESKQSSGSQSKHDASLGDQHVSALESSNSDPLRPLLVHGLPAVSEVLYAMRVIPAPAQPASTAKRAGSNGKLTGPTTRYNVDFLIDWKKVKLELTPKGNHAGRILVSLLARDSEGQAVNWAGGTMILDLNPTTYAEIQKSGIRAHAEIDLPQTNIYLATGVYDLAANKAGTLEIPLDARPALKAQAAVNPPVSK